MGVSERLARFAANAPTVLVVAVPGNQRTRWTVEDVVDQAGWRRAASPAYATLLVVCGRAGPELTPYLDVAAASMPGPRERVDIVDPTSASKALAQATERLADLDRQRQDARDRSPAALGPPAQDDAKPDEDHGDMDMGDMGDMDMDMTLPGGLSLADRMEDRDGLRLEGLRLTWGPVLPDWPAGLVLHLDLSGDVVRAAKAQILDDQPGEPVEPHLAALDALACLLAGCGALRAARRVRAVRADESSARRPEHIQRIAGSRALRWSLRGLPGPHGSSLIAHLDRVVDAVESGAALPRTSPDDLARALVGLELGAVHAVVSAFGPSLETERATARA